MNIDNIFILKKGRDSEIAKAHLPTPNKILPLMVCFTNLDHLRYLHNNFICR